MQKKRNVFRTLLEWGGMFLFVLTLSLALVQPAQAATRTLSLNNTFVSGNMNVSGGEDVYNFTLSKDAELTVEYVGLSIRDSYVGLYNRSSGEQYFRQNVYYSSASEPKTYQNTVTLSAGNYSIKVSGYNSSMTGTYKVRAKVTYYNTNTGNNSLASAQTISRGSTVSAALTSNDRADYYKLVVPVNHKVKIQYHTTVPDTWFQVYNASKTSIYKHNVYTASAASPMDDVYEQTLNAGTYYIGITPYYSDRKDTGSYTLKWSMPGYSETSISTSMTVPKGVTATAENYKSIRVKWNKVSNVSGYHIYYATSKNGTYKKAATVTNGNTTSTVINNLQIRKAYYFKVQTYKGKLKSNFSTPATGYTKDVQAQITSAKLSGKDAAVITWKKIPGVSGYEVTRKIGNSGSYQVIATVKSSTLTYKNTGLAGSTTYRYAIRPKYNLGGNTYYGSASSSASVKTPAAVTKYRALLIGEGNYSYTSASNLAGPTVDVNVMQRMLQNMKTPYTVVKKTNQSKSQILNAITSTFKGAGPNDVSLFYYSGHGVTSYGSSSGALYAVDGNMITTVELANALKKVPGKVIVLLDSCGSGAAISTKDGQSVDMDAEAFTSSVYDAFAAADSSVVGKAGELATSKFVVMAAAAPRQSSWDTPLSEGGYGGLFTYTLAKGVGCSYPYGYYSGSMPSDSNKNGKVTLAEIYKYINSKVASRQTTTVYPSTTSTYNMFIRK